MCGFAGFLDLNGRTLDGQAVALRMAATLQHRGPDDSGVWADEGAGLALGFRRLAILDLTESGHQPIVSADGRWVLVFNGEIYNHGELRGRIPDMAWRGRSDSEVLVETVARFGIDRALASFDGMFALALWDRLERVLYLARDRLGEKPLYYSRSGNCLLFGSELKSLRAHPAWDGTIDRDALALYMRQGWISAPHSIHAQAKKLPPGQLMSVKAGQVVIRAYWSARERAETLAGTFTGGRAAAAERLNQMLRASIALRMQADVPVGVFLSGGVDSSLLAAAMQTLSSQPVHTFTIGFERQNIDESPHARRVARRLGTRHTEVRITDDDALALIPDLPTVWDEPFADNAQIPTLLLARIARSEVSVALSGDGADELFGGYGIYRSIPADWAGLARLPGVLRLLAGAATGLPLAAPLNALAGLAGLAGRRRSYPGYRLVRALENLSAASLPRLMGLHYSRWRGMASPVLGANPAFTVFDTPGLQPALDDPALTAMVLDALSYLPDDLCVKTDRATMAVSLEARLPFLDHAIAEFAWSLPSSLKHDEQGGKAVLRDVLYGYLPRDLVDRPKMGFTAPIGEWLRGRLKDWAGDLLSEERLKRQGFLDAALVSRCWREHLGGRKNWQNELWHALMFQAWLDKSTHPGADPGQ